MHAKTPHIVTESVVREREPLESTDLLLWSDLVAFGHFGLAVSPPAISVHYTRIEVPFSLGE